MRYDSVKFEEIMSALNRLVELLQKSNFSKIMAQSFSNALHSPTLTDNFWNKFSNSYKKILDVATKFSVLTNESPTIQLEVKRIVTVLRMIEVQDFVESFKKHYFQDNSDELAKKKLRAFVKALLSNFSKYYVYTEKPSNEYDIHFELVSVDSKKILIFTCSIDTTNKIQVYGSAKYKDHDFEFDVDQIKFDSLLFPTLVSCVNELISSLDLRVAMKVSGTRVKIASYIFLLSSKDLALAKADLLKDGITSIFSVTGDNIEISNLPSGRLLDPMNTLLFGDSENQLYFNVLSDIPKIAEIKFKPIQLVVPKPAVVKPIATLQVPVQSKPTLPSAPKEVSEHVNPVPAKLPVVPEAKPAKSSLRIDTTVKAPIAAAPKSSLRLNTTVKAPEPKSSLKIDTTVPTSSLKIDSAKSSLRIDPNEDKSKDIQLEVVPIVRPT